MEDARHRQRFLLSDCRVLTALSQDPVRLLLSGTANWMSWWFKSTTTRRYMVSVLLVSWQEYRINIWISDTFFFLLKDLILIRTDKWKIRLMVPITTYEPEHKARQRLVVRDNNVKSRWVSKSKDTHGRASPKCWESENGSNNSVFFCSSPVYLYVLGSVLGRGTWQLWYVNDSQRVMP